MFTPELITNAFRRTIAAPSQRDSRLIVHPICLCDEATEPRAYLTLDEASRDARVAITEVSPGGVVQELRVSNGTDGPVLLVDGEQLLGAKQNRVVNLTILVPAHATLTVPVSCVEQGRWSSATLDFVPAPDMLYASARVRKMRDVTNSMRQRGDYRGNQAALWDDVAKLSSRYAVQSTTGEMDAVYRHVRQDLDDLVAHFSLMPRQVGAALSTPGGTMGVELFDHPDTWRAMMPRVLRSYGLEALRPAPSAHVSPVDGAARLLETLTAEPWEGCPGVGLGHSLRLSSGALTGAALEWQGHLVHLTAIRRGSVH